MKIAHISDFHLRWHLPGTSAVPVRLSRRMPELVEVAVQQINAHAPDLVVVSGDLVDHPFEAMDSPENRAMGKADLALIAGLLQQCKAPTAVLYGNHDHPGLFHEVFDRLALDFFHCGHRILTFLDAEGENNYPERIGAQWDRFEALTADGDPRPQIHLQHYLVAPERNQGYPHTYRNADRIKARLLADGRVRLLLNGHYHPGVDLFCQDGVYFSTAPAFCQAPHAFRMYTLQDENITQEECTLDI
jgi:Icc protein